MRTSFRPARRRAPRTGRWPHQPGTQTKRRSAAATCGQHRVPNPRKPVGVNQSYFSCFISHVSILMFHLHPSGNGRCGSNGLSLLKACAIQPLRATLGATAETNCLGLGQRARLRRYDRNAARSAGRGEGYQGKEGLQAVLPASFTSSINCPLRMDRRIRLNDVPVGVGRPFDANGSPADGDAGSASPSLDHGIILRATLAPPQPKRACHKALSHKAHRPRRRADMRPFDPVPRSTAMIH